jgi:hypothetical protein
MKKYIGLFILFVLLGYGSDSFCDEDYVDLYKENTKCEDKVFPAQTGVSCPSGSYDQYTIRQLTDFGQRPSFSPDGKRVAFIDEEFGDAYEVNVDTGEIYCITCEYEHHGFLRVQFLKDGDYLFLGPDREVSEFQSRFFYNGFSWMPKDHSKPPVYIGGEHFEGMAISRESRKIAFTNTFIDKPLIFPSKLIIADITEDGKIINEKVVYRSMHIIEPQDFLPGDKALVFSQFSLNKEAYGIDFETGITTNYSKSPAYDEPEGIFPDGKYTLVESNKHSKHALWKGAKSPYVESIDIYMLGLDGSGNDVRRLTHFSDVPGEKANNPVVSPRGCKIAFMKAQKPKEWFKFQGDSKGIYLLEFFKCSTQQ